MRRREQEIKDRGEIDEIIRASKVCRLGLAYGNTPYVVPICFGYDGRNLYFHSARSGMKIDILKKNPSVSFEFDICGELTQAEKACDWGIEYKSVIGFGSASFVEDEDEKREALDLIMDQYANGSFDYPPGTLKAVAVIKIEIESITGKHSS